MILNTEYYLLLFLILYYFIKRQFKFSYILE